MPIRDSSSIQHAVRDAFAPSESLVLAVSGGIDSMVLLHAAAAMLPLRPIVVATFDHATGPAATRAREHVERCCERAGVLCVSERATERLSSEDALRRARWRFLHGTARVRHAVVATAHTEDDHVETVVMRILRSAGARGLAGLYAASEVRRPLLGFTRREIAAYAAEHHVEWVEDPSNTSPRHFRNRIRHDLLPAARRVNPEFALEILALSRRAAELRADVERFARQELGVKTRAGGLDVPVQSLRELDDAGLRILWPAVAAMAGATLDRRAIARLADFTKTGKIGARVPLAGGWKVVRSRDALQLRASGLEAPGESVFEQSTGICWGAWSIRPSESVGRDAWSAWLPREGVLTIRSWRAGDVLAGRRGRAGQRKVKHLLSNAGVTGHERAAWPVVLLGDEIIWVPGVSRSDAATVRSGRPVLAFACEQNR